MKRFIKLVMILAVSVVLSGCGEIINKTPSSIEQFNQAIKEGRLSDAETILSDGKIKVEDGFYNYCTILIDEYLDIDNLDKAIYVFDRISSNHCDMYEMQYSHRCSTSSYTEKNSQKIYKQLIKNERFDEAWNYHPLSYDGQDYPGNGGDYYEYMTDVIVHLCAANRKAEAQQFIKTHIHWFTRNVRETSSYYESYSKNVMQRKLQEIIDSF